MLDTPSMVVDELREIYLDANPHIRKSIDEKKAAASDDYELKKVVEEDGTVTKRRETAPGSQTLYGLFGPPLRREKEPDGNAN